MSVQGYCVACKAMRELNDTKEVTRSGLPTIAGKCAVCSGTIFVLGGGAPAPPGDGEAYEPYEHHPD